MSNSNLVSQKLSAITFITLLLFCFSSVSNLFASSRLVGKVSQVIDGDSIILKKGRKKYEIRLWGIDAPEYGQSYGAESEKVTTRLLKGKKVVVEVKKKDSYDRLVGVVYHDGKNINGELVKSGSVWVYNRYCKDSICNKWKTIEKRNEKMQKGLWRKRKPVPPWVWRRTKKK